MASVSAPPKAKLNPQAPEFFPQLSASLTFDLHYNFSAASTIFSANPNFYYPNPYLHTYTSISHSHYPLQIPPTLPQPPDLPPVHEPEAEEEPVLFEEVKRRGVNKGYKNRCFWRRGGGRGSNQGKRGGGNVESLSFRKAKALALPKLNHPVEAVQHHGQQTSVMIRNIPNRYTRKLLLEFLDNHCMMENEKLEVNNSEAEQFVTAYDFLYLPIDFKTNVNKGYAFVNFTDPRAVWRFHLAFHNQKWELFSSPKICQIACARLQGKEELVKHLKNMPLECESEEFLPICFSPPRDGTKKLVKQWTVGKRIETQTRQPEDLGVC